jgi:glycosyl transferase family 25
MLVYYVNLDRHPDRRAHMQAALDGVDSSRVAAVDGEGYPDDEGGVTGFERACIESHRKAWTAFLATGDAAACFLEDDVVLADDFAELVAGASWVPADAHVVKIDTFYNKVAVGRARFDALGRSVSRLYSRHESTAGYVLTRSGARALLDATSGRARLPLDYVVFPEAPEFRGLVLYQMEPAAVVQAGKLAACRGVGDPIRSTMARRKKRRSFAAKLGREAGRLGKHALRGVRYAYLAAWRWPDRVVVEFG